jgi:hypothetical protein
MLLRLLVAGFFTFLFLRALSLSLVPAFLGGLLYIFSGTFTWFINLEQMVNVAMMVPVLFLCLERLLKRGRWGEVTLAGVTLALVLLAGQPEIALYLISAAYLYYIIRLFLNSKHVIMKRSFGRGIFDICVVSIFGLALAAPLLVPFLELWANAHHIHQAGGPMGAQALPMWNRILPIVTPTATEIVQDPMMVAGLCPLVFSAGANFFRYLPINGVWDSLGGYSGVLPFLLAISGLIFFSAIAMIIILKNIGVRPFIWLGSIPLFDQVWSLRWAGPIWTFALAAAGAIGLQMILPDGCSGAVDGTPEGGAQMAPHPLIRKIERYLQRKPHMPVVFSFLIMLVFYLSTVFADTVMLVLRSAEIFNARMEPFISPSIGGAVIVFLLILFFFLLIGVGVSRSIKGKGYAAFVFLAGLELWWAIPRGYAPETLTLKWAPFIIGVLIVVFFYKRVRSIGIVLSIIFLASILYIDINSASGLPGRSDPFDPPPYVEFIKSQEGHFRVAGAYGTLLPNFASSVGLMDVHYVNSLIPSAFHNLRTNHLHADAIEEEPVSSLWFTGRPERCEIIGEGMGYRHYYRPIEDDFLKALKGYSLLGVKYFIMPSNMDLTRAFPLIYDKEVRIFRNPIVLDRTWVVRDLRFAGSSEDAQATTFDPEFYPSRSAVVEEAKIVELFKEIDSVGISGESVEITSYAPERVEIKAELKRAGLVVLSDTFYPGWLVSVNGEESNPLRVDGTLRGVFVQKGKNEIVWEYKPRSFRAGLIIFGLSIFVCAFFFIRTRSWGSAGKEH